MWENYIAMSKTLAELLKTLRVQAHMSQRTLWKKSGVDRGHISKLESGEDDNITLATARRLAEALGIKASVFLEDDSPGTPDTVDMRLAKLVSDLKDCQREFPRPVPIYDHFPIDKGATKAFDYLYMRHDFSVPRTQAIEGFVFSDSTMSPEIKLGDVLVMHRGLPAQRHDIVILEIGDESFVGILGQNEGEYTVSNKAGEHRAVKDLKKLVVVVAILRILRTPPQGSPSLLMLKPQHEELSVN